MTTIADLESGLQRALECVRDLEREGRLPDELRPLLCLCPAEGASVHVSLRDRDKAHQLRRGFAAQAFAQRSCGAWIVFEVPHDDWQGGAQADRPFEDFVRVLDLAEREPQLQFVSLKWFRDTFLLKAGCAWAQEAELAQQVLLEALERDVVRTTKVANPRFPEHPVTGLVLNRESADARRILGAQTDIARASDASSSAA